MLLLCLFCAALASSSSSSPSSIVAVVTNSLNMGATAAAVISPVDGSQSSFHGFPPQYNAVLPDCFAVLDDDQAVICVSLGSSECLQFFSLSNGSLTRSWCSKELVIDNVGYDAVAKTLYFGAYNMTSQANFVFSISYTDPAQGPKMVVRIPGIVQVAINAISSSKHLLFLTLEEGGGGANLITIDLRKQAIAYNVSVDPDMEALFYDDSADRLFVWAATEQWAAALYVVNYKTGAVVGHPYYTSPTLSSNEAAVVYDAKSQTMYAQLMDFQNGNWPSWVAVNVVSRNSTVHPVPQNVAYPWILTLGIWS